jgi:outer membrane protein TolC
MKVSQILLFGLFCLGFSTVRAQDRTSLTLEQAIQLAWNNSTEVTTANTKVASSKLEVQSAKNNQYPDAKISGQYQRLTNADISSKLGSSTSTTDIPNVNQVLLGQATISLPIFNGFKIQNKIKLSDQLYQAEAANAMQTKEQVALKVVDYYAALYKAQKTIELLKENQKSATQRVTDFIELEKNGIIPRNDLMKAKLQVSNTQLSLDQASSQLNIVNYALVTLLKVDEDTKLEINESDFTDFQMDNVPTSDAIALENRKDLEAIQLQEKASLANVKIAKGGYYPSISLLGGYTALDLQNVFTVTNAINFGVGASYDLSGIFKNGNNVKIAESKAEEAKNAEAMLTDYIKMQVQKSTEDYNLALKQNVVYNEAVDQATENYRIVKDKYDNGLSDTNDLLEADVEQLSTKINQALGKANAIQKYYELLSVSGQLNQTFNLSKI